MRKTLIGLVIFSLPVLTMAQGRGRGPAPNMNQGSMHSNAPMNSPAASPNREFGKQRASDVGKGKKKGITKPKNQKANAHAKSK
jgi:hypothetical protein